MTKFYQLNGAAMTLKVREFRIHSISSKNSSKSGRLFEVGIYSRLGAYYIRTIFSNSNFILQQKVQMFQSRILSKQVGDSLWVLTSRTRNKRSSMKLQPEGLLAGFF